MSAVMRITVGKTTYRVMLRGKGVKNFDATVTPSSLNFGEVLVNQDGTATVTLTNTGLQNISPVPSVDHEVFSVSASGTGALAKGDTRQYVVTFSPSAVEAYTGVLTIKDESCGINLTISLNGKGVNTVAPYVVELAQNVTTNKEVTVCESTSAISSLPINTNYMDWGTESQMIYPAELLGLRAGDKIKSITFYASSALSTPSDGSDDNPVIVKVGTTSATTLSSLVSSTETELTQVCSASVWSGNNSVTFTFNPPYEYKREEDNLLLDLSCEHNEYALWGSTNWNAVESKGSGYCQWLTSSGNAVSSQSVGQVNYLPMMTLAYERTQQSDEYVRAEVVDWGAQNADKFYSKEVTICNPNSEAVNATLTTTEQFYFANNTGATSKTASLPAGNSTLTLYFNPTAAAAYTGSLIITVDGHSSSTRLTGVGLKAGEIATRDSSFFASKTYDWTDSDGNTHTSNLAEIATDPDQIIALVREVYTNTDIPGNYKRGYTSSEGIETGYNVTYPGVGTIVRDNNSVSYSPSYGWDIPGDISTGTKTVSYTNSNGYTSTTSVSYAYMDSMQYKPKYEGVTLLMAEMIDNFDLSALYNEADGMWENKEYDSDAYKNLRCYIQNTVKSMRVITSAKRTGSGTSAGTLFKIDADKLNKYYLLAKGRLRWVSNSYEAQMSEFNYRWLGNMFCSTPCFLYNTTLGLDGYFDSYSYEPFHYMFEQFSPVTTQDATGLADIYQELVNMNSFGVVHDCASVPILNHQFMMYGEESEAADCQDVRDMMFFVPDYRMMNYSYTSDGKTVSRDNANNPGEKFLNYHKDHQPTMGLYVIHQDAVQGQKVSGKDLYDLTLTWKSNMDEFLPRDQQEYQLYQLITDEFGDEHWEPVYYRNANGEYRVEQNGQVSWKSDTAGLSQYLVPITLSREALTSTTARHTYDQVYIDQKSSGQTVTFAVRGQDADHFLSLQMSNEESFFIPGTDPTELLHTTSATYYSRFEPQQVHNCYSNKIQVEASPNSIRTDYFEDGTDFEINRTWYEQVDGTTVPHTVKVATARVTDQKSYLTITVDADTQSPESMFPKGKSDGAGGRAAGYHANPETYKVPISLNLYGSNEYASFSFVVWDNFVADVSKNEHPGQYAYEVVFQTITNIEGTEANPTNQGHSNRYNVPVYKTDSRISEPRTLAEVLGDTQMNPDYSPSDVAFDAQVQYSSKQNILRYDAYRWNEGEDRYVVDQVYSSDDEQDLPPTGIAGNQGESYSVTMNAIGSDDYYVGSAVPVNTTNTTNWATFVDYYPTNAETEAGAYVYAPVVELFTRGNKADDATAKREDYNTYGGPLQNTAVGKLAVKAYQPSSADQGGANALMSNYWWMGDGTTGVDGEKYSYYNIMLDYEALDVPEGYELYKVRAWRKVDKSVLGEILPTRRKVRIGQIDADGWYLFEDMNYGDALNEEGTMKMALDRLYDRDRQKTLSRLGARSARIARPTNPDGTGGGAMFGTEDGTTVTGQAVEEAVTGELRATFGARRLDLNGEDNDFSRLDAQFKVRAYFTRKSNPLIAGASSSNAPRRAGAELTPADYDYYIAEGECEFHQDGGSGVVTGIDGVKADLNHEVESVNYVNTIGQVSNRPWQGVNVVVTRYTDGTTKTTKAVY